MACLAEDGPTGSFVDRDGPSPGDAERLGSAHVPLGGVFREPDPTRDAALRHRALARRAEPRGPSGGRQSQRRRPRPGLVRRPRRARAVPQHRAGVGRPQPARAVASDRVAAVPRPYPRGDGNPGRADQLPPVPPWPLAVHAQRLHRRLPAAAPRAAVRGRPRRVRRHRGHDRLRADVPPRADVRARAGAADGAGAHGRIRRGDRSPSRRRRAAADDRRRERRRAALRGPLRERSRRQLAVRHRRRERRARAASRGRAVPSSSPTRRARSSPSRSATCPASGTRCRPARRSSSSPARTRSCRSRRARRADAEVRRCARPA